MLAAVMVDFGVRQGATVSSLYMPIGAGSPWSRCWPARGSARCIPSCSAVLRQRSLRPGSTMPPPKLIFSASWRGWEPGRIVQYKPLLDEAIRPRKQLSLKPASSLQRAAAGHVS